MLLECEDGERVERPCTLGCAEVTATCNSFDPTGAVTAADLQRRMGELEISLPTGAVPTILDTRTGAITRGADELRQANTDAESAELHAGITFERRGGLGIFRARLWTLHNAYVQGDLPIAIVASDRVVVNGHLLAACGQVGGAPKAGSSPGNGGAPMVAPGGIAGGAAGGGGGAFGTAGAHGGVGRDEGGTALTAGVPGSVFLFDPNQPRGGGRGGGLDNPGLGGGAVFLIAGSAVQIGDGVATTFTKPGDTAKQVAKGVNVGGCGAYREALGGGAGGLIVVEAPTVSIQSNAGLAANGGGGGSSSLTSFPVAAEDGALSLTPARGGRRANGESASYHGHGGDGAAGSTAATQGAAATEDGSFGGGGGGGLGRVFIRTVSGYYTSVAGSVLSPSPATGTLAPQ